MLIGGRFHVYMTTGQTTFLEETFR